MKQTDTIGIIISIPLTIFATVAIFYITFQLFYAEYVIYTNHDDKTITAFISSKGIDNTSVEVSQNGSVLTNDTASGDYWIALSSGEKFSIKKPQWTNLKDGEKVTITYVSTKFIQQVKKIVVN